MIADLVGLLAGLDEPPTAQEVAEALWLAPYLPEDASARGAAAEAPSGAGGEPARAEGGRAGREGADAAPPGDPRDPTGTVHLPGTAGDGGGPVGTAVHARLSGVAALPGPLRTARALRPLRRTVPSRHRRVLDEEATARAAAATGRWLPRLRPERERWLDLVVVCDESLSMLTWAQTVREFTELLRRLGAFRDVRVWRFDGDRPGPGGPELRTAAGERRGPPERLLDATGRRLVMVVSDCVGRAWGTPGMDRLLALWSRRNTVVVVQPLPERLWSWCAAGFTEVELRADTDTRRGRPHAPARADVREQGPDHVPVVELSPDWLSGWARVAGASAAARAPGVGLLPAAARPEPASERGEDPAESPTDRLRRFRASVSPTAFALARYLSAAPLSLPVMRLVQRVMLPGAAPAHIAEILLAGLVRPITVGRAGGGPGGGELYYDFVPGVRSLLLASLNRRDTRRIFDQTSEFLEPRTGQAFDFPVTLAAPGDGGVDLGRYFAAVRHEALRAMAVGPTPGREAPAPSEPVPAGRDAPRAAPGRSPAVAVTAQAEPEGANMVHPTSEPARADRPPEVWGEDIPPRHADFTGRDALLLTLRNRLSRQATAVLPHTLHGMGGVGKTQLAVEYVYRFRNDYDLVWWIYAEHADQIRSSFMELAQVLGLPAEDTDRTIQQVLDILNRGDRFPRWLLVFDNAGSPDTLRRFLSNPTGHVLVTSRNRSWRGVTQLLEVDVFERDESVRLLRRVIGDISADDASQVAEQLGDLPLAVEQAAAWLRQTSMPIEDYLELLDERISAVLEEEPESYPRSVRATWDISFNGLEEDDRAAAALLRLCSFFGPEPIAFQLLKMGRLVPDTPEPLAQVFRDALSLSRAIRKIGLYSLAQTDPIDNSVQIHRLVQAIIRDRLPEDERERYAGLATRLMAAANPSEPDNQEHWPRLAEISRHARATNIIDSDDYEVRTVVLDLIRYRYRLADYEGSYELGDLAIRTWRERYGPDDEQTLVACRHVGITLRELKRNEEARRLNEDTLERMVRVFGEDHDHTLLLRNSYGADLRFLNRYDDALKLDEENLAKHRQIFGPNSLWTLRVMNNLALDYRLQGDSRRARDLDRRALQISEQILGPRNRDTLFTMTQLARDLRGTGEYTEALRLLEAAIPAYEALLGKQHREVIEAHLGYAITLRRFGRMTEAQAEAQLCLDLLQRETGTDHSLTISAMWTLADALRLQGDIDGAERLAELAVATALSRFGEEHLWTTIYRSNHSILVTERGQHQRSLEINTRVYEHLNALRGADHPYTLCIMANLASDHHYLGDHATALRMSRETVERSVRVRGEEHPLTRLCYLNYAIDLREAGRPDEADAISGRALEGFKKVVRDDHPEIRKILTGERLQFDIEPPIL
ncbi:FxSxx-COOH system tetratricopeptide repeat protein [Allonocardiopsis opalescens]|uniref:Tetratricopeptide repeat protein n=1 Tax=Allonocardiopsis opalescens TaxID=1144618 RepID=A0A2T0QFP2_9ACTN|nr:FxSxx-COOH system tetratricopeptide repeat protein [Allonocardiopsis opalescens]PRY02700.1 tetratricopeptide repeat protein [Allonocardiopsis opalescens]